jgi:hypothetical protein
VIAVLTTLGQSARLGFIEQHREQVLNRKYQIAVFLASLLSTIGQATFAGQTESQDVFFQQISGLCGSRFVGQSVFPEDPGDAWKDKILVAHIESCTADEIRIPFIVGDDHSRTWILRRVEGGIQFKHDHRHADGTPDQVTMYGGTTQSTGSQLSQSFPADAYTAELIPEASTNEWFLSFNSDSSELTYYLERNSLPRFKAILLKK